MIVSKLADLEKQLKANAAFQEAIEFLHREGWRGHADGTVPIDGERVYGMLQSYDTKIPADTVPFEGHRKYIDIQFVIEGKETIFYKPTAELTPTIPYDETKDIWFCQAARQDSTAVAVAAGQLVVLFPEDAHAPTHCVSAPMHVRKIVIKVAV